VLVHSPTVEKFEENVFSHLPSPGSFRWSQLPISCKVSTPKGSKPNLARSHKRGKGIAGV